MGKKVARRPGRPRSVERFEDCLAGRVAFHLQRIRRRLGLSVADAAARCQIPLTNFYRLEKGSQGRAVADNLDAVARGLGVDISELTRRLPSAYIRGE